MAEPISLGAGAAAIGTSTLGWAGLGATALGGITSAIGKIMGGESQAGMYKYQAGTARINEQIAKQNADYARYTGEVETQRVGMKSRFEVGQATTVQSGRGIDISTGSAAEVRSSMGDLGRHDQATTRANAARRAYGHDVEAAKASAQGRMYVAASSNARSAGYIDAFGSILGTAGSVASRWLDAGRMGIGSGRGISLAPSPDFPSEMDFT